MSSECPQVLHRLESILPVNRVGDIGRHLIHLVDEFNTYTFPAGFGFDPFSVADVVAYLSSEDHYNLSLRKVRGKGILYGTIHAKLRRRFFNDLPIETRVAVIMPKLKHFKIDRHLRDFVGMRSQVPILDVEDIGMGHSVYRLTTPHGDLVVKQEDVPNQQFYMEFQRALGYPWFRSKHYIGQRTWELTDYLGNSNLNEVLVAGAVPNWTHLIDQLAGHAAMGDVLGREDRHFENYVVQGPSILPVDTSMLFGDGNEVWSERYIAGGLYEICVLGQFRNEPRLFRDYFTQFRNAYMSQLKQLMERRSQIETLIGEFFDEDPINSHRCRYVRERLENLAYPDAQFERYRSALEEMMMRRVVKQAISDRVSVDPSILARSPILKMYYLADQGRVSTLFLLEYHRDAVMSALKAHQILSDAHRAQMTQDVDLLRTLPW